MSPLRQSDKVLAIFCSDIHLSARPPRARRNEPDWYLAMSRPLNELKALSERYEAPIICCGDVFDHWRAEPELINFAISNLPRMYAIPGQHDLPLHNIDKITQSAYWTMVLVGKIIPVKYGFPMSAENDLVIHGFPWGTTISSKAEEIKESSKKHVAICHQYFWQDGYAFPGAPEEQEASTYANKIRGYHAVAFGDNHKGFLTSIGGVSVLNCGGFMRRRTDEEFYEPAVGLLLEGGGILLHRFRLSYESFTADDEEEENGIKKVPRLNDASDFVAGLRESVDKTFDFVQALEFVLERDKKMISVEVRDMVLRALERK